MTSEFISLFGQLNLLSFFLEKQLEVIEKSGLTVLKDMKIFGYGKNNDRY